LNSYLKSCFGYSKNSVKLIVDRWLATLEHDVKKELKVIGEKLGNVSNQTSIFGYNRL